MLPDPCGTGFVQNFPHLPPAKSGKNKRKDKNYRKKVYRKNSTIKRNTFALWHSYLLLGVAGLPLF